MYTKFSLPAVALIVAACGSGGTGDASEPPPAAASPAPPAASPVPTPITPPIASPAPAPSPVSSIPPAPPKAPEPPAGTPTPPPVAPPAEGTYVPGNLVQVAIATTIDGLQAYEPDGDGVTMFNGFGTNWTRWTQPQDYRCPESICPVRNVRSYPFSGIRFDAAYIPGGDMVLGPTAHWSSAGWGDRNPPLTRSTAFTIKPTDKLPLDTTIAQWNDGKYYVQIQVGTYQPSNTVFRLCLHIILPDVKNLSCTLHDRINGALRGLQVIDDSAGLGAIEYRSSR